MKRFIYLLLILLPGSVFTACGQNGAAANPSTDHSQKTNVMSDNPVLDTATFGAGCFWCVEAQFQMLDGVISVTSGYSGGTVKNPAYREVCNGTTGHAEVVQVVYDTTKLSYDEMLEAFWHTHDPTQLNRQGNDVGTQYRSVIFYHNEEQKKKAEHYKQQMNEKNTWGKPVVTEISAFTTFYKAEDYHQNYYKQNGNEGYCQYVVRPKVEKFREVFKEKLKK
jgi:peptide-methionine (S)-S-oxide reductase